MAAAVLAARPTMPDEEFRRHRQVVRDAGAAKHVGLGPSSPDVPSAATGTGGAGEAAPTRTTLSRAVERELAMAQFGEKDALDSGSAAVTGCEPMASHEEAS